MEGGFTNSVSYTLILFTTAITGVKLQDENWNTGYLVPHSKIVFSPPLLFPHYRFTQFHTPTIPHPAGSNLDHKEIGTIRDSEKTKVLARDSEVEVQSHSDSIDARDHVQGGYSENIKYNTINSFNNITWHAEFGKEEMGRYQSDSDIPGRKLTDPNRMESKSDIGSRRVDNHRSDFDLDVSGHQLNNPNLMESQSDISSGRVYSHRNDSDLDIPRHQLSDSNNMEKQSDIDSRRVDNHHPDLDVSRHKVSKPSSASLDNHNEHRSQGRTRNITWSTELDRVRTGHHQSNPGIWDAGHHLSDSDSSMMGQDGPSRAGHYQSISDLAGLAGHQKSNYTIRIPTELYIDRSRNAARRHTILDTRNDSEQSINDFEKNRLGDFGTSRNRQYFEDRSVLSRYDLGINDFSNVTWHSGSGTEIKQDNGAQNRTDSKKNLYNIIAWHSDSSRSQDKEDGIEDRYDSERNSFGFDKWQSDYGRDRADQALKGEKYISNDSKDSESSFTENTWFSDIGTSNVGLRISSGSKNYDNVQHSDDSVRNRFGAVMWPSDTIREGQRTSGNIQDSANSQNGFNSEGYHSSVLNGHGNYGTNTRVRGETGQDQFNLQRSRFGGWHNGYSSEIEYRVPEFDQERGFGADRNSFSGTSWHSDFNSDGERQRGPIYEEASDGEPIKNQYTGTRLHGGEEPLQHGTRVATGPPTAISSYTLPNGTRVVRLRRIVRFRKPQSPPQEESPRTLVDIAKGIVQKKVAKFLSLFTIVQFPNEPCQTGEGINGTCYHHLECRSLGGVASGSCAQGYGVCCYFERSCGEVTRQNCSYFVNPGFPAPITNMLACILTIEKAHPDVSQIRLDFFMFELLGPTNGTCVEDQFIVTGQNTNSIAPIICGINTGQHIYMDVDSTTGPFRLNMLTMGGDIHRSFRIKVTQIKRGSPLEAPRNCLQFYRGIRGSIESFNYQMLVGSNLSVTPGYMNNLNYAICIQKEPGFCTVTYTNTAPDGTAYPFQLTNVDEDGVPLIPPGQAGAEVFNCPDDYIVINGIRLCGERLNDASVQLDFTRNYPVTDTSNGPFMIPVRTNANTNGRGFKIDYQQNSCAS